MAALKYSSSPVSYTHLLAEEDPTFTVKTDEQSGQTIISGMGELHLDIIIDRLKREFKVECNQGKPQVNYKEEMCIRDSI